MKNRLDGKVALVTGASSGIGRAVARCLHGLGAKLVLVARNQERLEELAKELGGDTIWFAIDLANSAEIPGLIQKTVEHFGSIDVLIENAGVFGNRQLADTAASDIEQMVDVNLTSVMLLAQATLPYMQSQKSGEILVIGSIAGVTDMRNEAVYAATKHGINAFVRSLRRQVQKDGIRVGSVLPGTVATELWADLDPSKTVDQVATREILLPADIANIIAFMLQQPDHVSIREIVVLPQAQDI